MSNIRIDYILAWHFVASQNDDEIYAYGTDFQAKQFCNWLNHERTRDLFKYSEVVVSEILTIRHMLFSLEEAIDAHSLSPSSVEFLSKSRESTETIVDTAYPPFLDKHQLEAKIFLAISAIIQWNRRHLDKFTITPLLIKRTTGLSAVAICDALLKHQRMIDMHYDSMGWNVDWPPSNKGTIKRHIKDLKDYVKAVL